MKSKHYKKFNMILNGIAYNNDEEALKYMINLDKKYEIFDKEIESVIFNEFKIRFHNDDFISHIKKKMIIYLLTRLKDKKTCNYCFDNDKKNEIIYYSKKTKENTQKNLEKKELEELGIDFDLLDDDFDLFGDENKKTNNLLLRKENTKLKDDMEPEKIIFCCHNCMKIYYKYDQVLDITDNKSLLNYKNILPFQDSIYMWVEDFNDEDYQLSHSLIWKNKNDLIELSIDNNNFINPYDHIEKINEKFINNKKNSKEYLIKFLKLYKNKDNYFPKIIDNSNKLIEEFYIHEEDEFDKSKINIKTFKDINFSLFQDLALYYARGVNKYKHIDLYSNLYYPFMDFKTFYIRFIIQEKTDTQKFISSYESSIKYDDDKYSIKKTIIPWLSYFEKYDDIIDHFEEIKGYGEYETYTTKVFFDFNNINRNKNENIIIFSNIIHLFEMTQKIPFLNTYLSEESQVLEKYYNPLHEDLQKYNWTIQNKNIIQFKILLSKEIKQINGAEQNNDYYYQLNLYENGKIEVTISLPMISNIYMSRSYINDIIQPDIEEFVDKLNSLNIFQINYDQLELLKPTINSINFYFKIPNAYDFDKIQGQLNNLQKCLYPYFIRDFDISSRSFRYIRIKNTEETNLTDKLIYSLYKEFSSFTENEKQIEQQIINSLQLQFNISDIRASHLYGNYISRYKNFNIKPPSFGIFFFLSEPELWKGKYLKLSALGIRSFNDIKKIKTFLSKLYFLIDKFSEPEKITDKNISFLYNLCYVEKFQKKEIESKDEIMILQQEKMQCNFDLNLINEKVEKNNKDIDKKTLLDNKKKIRQRITLLEKEINFKKKNVKLKNTNYFKYLTRLQQKFPNLDVISCDSSMINQYSKQCQKKRQPMGTGEGIQPMIIDFDKTIELEKIENNKKITCNYETPDKKKLKANQTGGNISDKYLISTDFEDSNIYEEWGNENKPELYPGKLLLSKCLKGKIKESYKIKDLKEVIKKYKINYSDDISKNDICNFIKQIENQKEITNMYKTLYAEGVFEEEGEKKKLKNVLAMRYSRFQYNKNKFYTDDEIAFFYKELGIKDKKISNKIFQNVLMEMIIEYDLNKEILIEFCDLTHIINLFSDNLIKIRVLYEIFYLYSNYWKEEHIREFFKILYPGDILHKKYLDEIYLFFEVFNTNFMKYEHVLKTNKYSNITLDDFIKKTNILIRTNEMGSIIQSVLKFNNKALTCPNFDDDKNNSMVGFLDLPINNIPQDLSDANIRNNYCQPCCFSSKVNLNSKETIMQVNYTKNVLFCTGKITYDEYKDILKNEQRRKNYISTNNSLNNPGTYGILTNNLSNFFNNYINLYNDMNKKKLPNIFMSNFKNNILKSPGFVLKGINQFNSYLNNILDATNYKKKKLINDLEMAMKRDKNLFYSLNQGELYIKYKTITAYIQALNNDIITPFLINDIISRKNILKKYPNGINVFIFKENKQDITLESYDFILKKSFISDDKTALYLYNYSTSFYETIALKLPKTNGDYILFNKNNDIDDFSEYNEVLNNFKSLVDKWYLFIEPKIFTIQDIITKLDKKNINGQLVDVFKKSLFLIYKNVLIPLKPQGFDSNIPIINTDDNLIKIINKYKKSLSSTLKYIKLFSIKINDKTYNFNKYVIKDNKIIGIELTNELLIDVIPQVITDKTVYNNVSKKIFFYEVNNVIFKEEKHKKSLDDIIEEYDEELFNYFKSEIANYININEKIKNKLINIINKKEDLMEDKTKTFGVVDLHLKIKKIINDIYTDLFINVSDSNVIKFVKNKINIRKLCSDIDKNEVKKSPFCDIDESGIIKMTIPEYKKQIFINIFSDNLLSNTIFSQVILMNKINPIIDKNLFISNENNLYVKKNIII